MKITRITKIHGHRIFRAFTWPSSMLPFSRFNVIYGWNGSGKTTLSSLFHHLERRHAVGEGDVDFEIDGSKVAGSSFDRSTLPMVRVFNRDFITATVVASTGTMSPIFYVGEDSAEKQKQVEALRKKHEKATAKLGRLQKEKQDAERALDDLLIAQAKLIKEVLISSRTTKYNNYDKRRLRQSIEKLTDSTWSASILSADRKESLQKKKDAQPKDTLPEFAVTLPDLAALAQRADELLRRSVVSEVIDDLAADPAIATWVQRGLELHSGQYAATTCRFCEQPLTETRATALRAHFNDAFARFQRDLADMERTLEGHRQAIAAVEFPEPSRCYDHLHADMTFAITGAREILQKASAFVVSLSNAVRAKREAPFEEGTSTQRIVGQPAAQEMTEAIDAIATCVQQHNIVTGQFQTEVDSACDELEKHYVAEAFADYAAKKNAAQAADDAVKSAAGGPATIQQEIDQVERQIVEHLRPAEELNAELRAYLGHEELHLEVRENGYAMTRSGNPATNLSEGERTAIAFLYFLKSLKDKATDLSKTIVVIDDPVSSLDATALFSAFGYMKDRTKEAGQLFIFTHNFSFFRQVRNWFHHLPGQRKSDVNARPARFYSLHALANAGKRCAMLMPIDPLLEQYESEYHYLFKRIHDEANQPDGQGTLEDYYGLPNIARRLLESFLAFRHPDQTGDLWKRLSVVQWDAAKKTRIMRFVNTHSHSNTISDAEHDPSILSETKSVLCDLLQMIADVDPEHHQGMTRLVCPADHDADSE